MLIVVMFDLEFCLRQGGLEDSVALQAIDDGDEVECGLRRLWSIVKPVTVTAVPPGVLLTFHSPGGSADYAS